MRWPAQDSVQGAWSKPITGVTVNYETISIVVQNTAKQQIADEEEPTRSPRCHVETDARHPFAD